MPRKIKVQKTQYRFNSILVVEFVGCCNGPMIRSFVVVAIFRNLPFSWDVKIPVEVFPVPLVITLKLVDIHPSWLIGQAVILSNVKCVTFP